MSNTALIIIGIVFIFLMTTLGSGLVFLFKDKVSRKLNTLILGFASGVMIAASIWSLLLPAIDEASIVYDFAILPVGVGFILGGIFLSLLDFLVSPLNGGKNNKSSPKIRQFGKINKSTRLFLAVTIHNIPEGLAVGLAFGGAILIGESSAFISALMLAFGIGIQNFPEGMAVALPLKNEYGSNKKAFLYGMISGAVEPLFAIVGILLVSFLPSVMPWLLAFSAGAMMFVVAEDLIPDSKCENYFHLGAWGVIIGFVLMMALDVSLG